LCRLFTTPNRLRSNPVWFILIFCLSGFIALMDPTSQGRQAGDELADYPWIYLRNGENPTESDSVSLIVVGDVMLGRGIADNTRIFDRVASWLSVSDYLLGNFEGVIFPPCGSILEEIFVPTQIPIRLCVPLTSPALLQGAGFDLLGLANNHSLDRGKEGLKDTAERLQRMGIGIVGASSTISGAYQPVYRTFRGVKMAFLAFNAVPDPDQSGLKDLETTGYSLANWNDDNVMDAIKTARSHSDAVIVSIHWGYEYDNRPSWWQQKKASMMVEAGADLVLGHHPHVIQKTQIFQRESVDATVGIGLVAYSLGNFVFDQYEEKTSQGLALRALLDKDGLRGVQALPVWTIPRPRLMSLVEMERVVEIVKPASKRIGFACNGKECVEVEVPQEAREGIFQEGKIDLTGDGRPEQVFRNVTGNIPVQGRAYDQGEGWVTIIQDGSQVWRSPSQWRVLDLALGDPDDDGRFELMLALQKPDGIEGTSSHPFIIGFRGGSYKDVWGGSAVADPIRELELGDLDADGVQELVVLEERGDGSRQAVTVWRWNGWGFSLEWRSSEGRYQDLVLLTGENGKSIISLGEVW